MLCSAPELGKRNRQGLHLLRKPHSLPAPCIINPFARLTTLVSQYRPIPAIRVGKKKTLFSPSSAADDPASTQGKRGVCSRSKTAATLTCANPRQNPPIPAVLAEQPPRSRRSEPPVTRPYVYYLHTQPARAPPQISTPLTTRYRTQGWVYCKIRALPVILPR